MRHAILAAAILAGCSASHPTVGDAGQLDATEPDADPEVVDAGDGGCPVHTWRALAAGNADTCLIGADGEVACTSIDARLHIVHGLPAIGQLAVNEDVACGIDGAGRVVCWRSSGRFDEIHFVAGLHDVVSLGGHFRELCATRRTGAVTCWRTDALPELLIDVPGVADALDADYGYGHGCYLRVDGHVLCWGDNNFGSLGVSSGALSSSDVPVEIPGLDQVTQIRCGGDFNSAVSRGRVLCWGECLGIDSAVSQWIPAEVPGLGVIVDIAVGGNHACALGESGEVWCWGGNQVGQIGTGATSYFEGVTQPFGIHDVTLMTTGGLIGQSHTCVAARDAAVTCWGQGSLGQLGNGETPLHSTMPVRMLDLCE